MNGQICVVTGATRGIGLATVRALVAAGAHVVLHGRDEEALAGAVASLPPGTATSITADLTMPGAARAFVERVLAQHGRIDVLVNNAGTSAAARPVWEASSEDFAATQQTNLVAAFACAQALIAWAVPSRATVRIVNVSSGAVARAPSMATDYVASKHGLEGMTRAMAQDLHGSGVCVVAVQLGAHRTELTRRVYSEDAHARLPAPEEAARAIVAAIGASADDVHGRTLAAWRLDADPDAERLLAAPLGASTPLALDDANRIVHPFGPSPAVQTALRGLADDPAALAELPDPSYALLRGALARHHDLPPDWFSVGAGASELLERCLRLWLRPGEAVVANAPSWPLFEALCAQLGLPWRAVPYRVVDGRVDAQLPRVLEAIDSATRVVYLVSPSNPGGAALDSETFGRFAAALPAHVLLILDEAYVEYVSRPEALDGLRWLRHVKRRAIVLRTFSKAYGLGGLRVGYAVAPPEIAQHVRAAALPFCVNAAAVRAALAALADRAHLRLTIEHNQRERARLTAALEALGVEVAQSDAPFLLVASDEPRWLGRYDLWPIGRTEDNQRRIDALAVKRGGARG